MVQTRPVVVTQTVVFMKQNAGAHGFFIILISMILRNKQVLLMKQKYIHLQYHQSTSEERFTQ